MTMLYTSGYNYSRKRCEDAVNWFISKYLPNHKLEIIVNHRGLLREGVFGWCMINDCNWRPRIFEIEIHNQLSPQNYTKTLLHELWHVFQHIKGDLRDKRGIRCWKGMDCSNLDYQEMPWEIEAIEKEQELYEDYIKFKSS
jgi:hypothetical protein